MSELSNIYWEKSCALNPYEQKSILSHYMWEALRKNYWLKEGAKEEDGFEAGIKPAVKFIKQGIVISDIEVSFGLTPEDEPTGAHSYVSLRFNLTWTDGKIKVVSAKDTCWSLDCDKWHDIKNLNMAIYKDIDQAIRNQKIFSKDHFDEELFNKSEKTKKRWTIIR